MKKQFILSVKVAWTVAAVVILVMYAGVCGSSDQACRPASDTLLIAMGALTFPAGVVCIIASVIVCALLSGEFSAETFTAWFLMMCGGCLQWYIIVPLLLEEPKFTFLNLNSTLTATSMSVEPSAMKSNSAMKVTPPVSETCVQAPRARKRHKRILAFDKFGRTPLERVINQRARGASA